MPGHFSNYTALDVKIVILEEAQRQFEAKDDWWRDNRDDKDLFIREFELALRRVVEFPFKASDIGWLEAN